MVTSGDSSGARTEPASQAKLQRARAAGDVPFSPLATSVCAIAGGSLALLFSSDEISGALRARFEEATNLTTAGALGASALGGQLADSLKLALDLSIPVLAAAAGAGLVAGFAQIGFALRAPGLGSSVARFDPVRNLRRSRVLRGSRGLGLALLVLFAATGVVWRTLATLMHSLVHPSETTGFDSLAGPVTRAVSLLIAGLLVAGLLDLLLTRASHRRRLRMTRQELQAERKSTEGDPRWRAARRRRHRASLDPTPTR